jgi:peptidoglycan/LPS O-acetylase OafA/YrhL
MPPEPKRYRADVDGLRAVAILPVILYHAGLGCTGGFVGVDVFFVISGFLITSLILKEIGENNFSLVMFWERRIRRIFPALFAVVLATIVAGWFLYFPDDFNLLGKSALAQAILMSNVFFWRQTGYFAPGIDTKPLLHTWSLAVEEQFYVLFPLLLIFLAWRKRSAIPQAIFWLGIGSFALSVVGCYFMPAPTFYLLPTRAWELMVGAFLAAIPGRQLSNPFLNETIGLSGLGLVLYAVFVYTSNTRFPGLAALPPCLGAALIICSGSGMKPALTNRMLALKPVVFIGLISYSLYLWHWPVLVFTKYRSLGAQSWELRAVLLMVSVALAVGSWKWIEMPFRRRLLCPHRPQVFAFAGCGVLTLMIFGGSVCLKHGVPSRLPADAIRVYDCKYNFAFRNEITPEMAAAGQFAELGAQNTNQPIGLLLWGDSHAMAVAPVLNELCQRFSVRGVEATHSSTAPILEYWNNFGLQKKSIAFSQSVAEFIVQRHIKSVILAANWHVYGPPSLVDSKLPATVVAIEASGASIYILRDVPIPDFNVPKQAALAVMRHGEITELGTSPTKYAADNHNYEPIFDHLSKLGATILDTPKYFLNTNGLYDVVRDDKILYFDNDHLTIDGSKLLTPMFEPLFRSH